MRLTFNGYAIVPILTVLIMAVPAMAHVFIENDQRSGAIPAYDGSGWVCEVFLDIPDDNAAHLLAAEAYVLKRPPDFTFKTQWIDFPSGPTGSRLDTSFATMSDFFDDHIFDVSDPTMLNQPFGNFLFRCNGVLSIRAEDDIETVIIGNNANTAQLPTWVEVGTFGNDGFRTEVGTQTVYRIPIVTGPTNQFFHENMICLGLGMYPIKVTFFNRYDPTNEFMMDSAGVEVYSLHGSPFEYPGGDILVLPDGTPASLIPPRVIYQTEDILPLADGDFNADGVVDMLDFQWMQHCHTGPGGDDVFPPVGCSITSCTNCAPGMDGGYMDFDDDGDVDGVDFSAFQDAVFDAGSP